LSKQVGESYLRCYHGLYTLKYAILRYANVYGPRQDPYGEAGVVAIFTQAMLKGEQPVIFGDGTQSRDFVYVGDVAQANLLALEAENVIVNIGTGRETPINALYEQLTELTGYLEKPRYEAPRPGEVYRIALDPQRAKQFLNWEAETPLEEGLKETVSSFQVS
jgi:UDP-glucose 4-epimerase